MLLEFNEDQVQVAHRIGQPTNDELRPRQIVAKLHPTLKDLVLKNKKNLKGKKNIKKHFFSIKTQLPDEWEEQRRDLQMAV